jgi:sugar/nucleoside kinase (ribokinase family)
VLCTLGDLLDDVVVWLEAAVAPGTDTPARIFHRRGGSAANVAAFAALAGHAVRFIGCVGNDQAGTRLTAALAATGVDVRVQRRGRTGTVVALVDPTGERTMLTDRGDAPQLAGVPDDWVGGIDLLHLTAYSLAREPVSSTAEHLAQVARSGGARLSLDVSSVRVVDDLGPEQFEAVLARLRPDVVLANAAEAARLGWPDRLPEGAGTVVVKRGPDPAWVARPGHPLVEVAVPPHRHVSDTTGAGDAFAAGFLGALVGGADAEEAARAGHRLAAASLDQPGAVLVTSAGEHGGDLGAAGSPC